MSRSNVVMVGCTLTSAERALVERIASEQQCSQHAVMLGLLRAGLSRASSDPSEVTSLIGTRRRGPKPQGKASQPDPRQVEMFPSAEQVAPQRTTDVFSDIERMFTGAGPLSADHE